MAPNVLQGQVWLPAIPIMFPAGQVMMPGNGPPAAITNSTKLASNSVITQTESPEQESSVNNIRPQHQAEATRYRQTEIDKNQSKQSVTTIGKTELNGFLNNARGIMESPLPSSSPSLPTPRTEKKSDKEIFFKVDSRRRTETPESTLPPFPSENHGQCNPTTDKKVTHQGFKDQSNPGADDPSFRITDSPSLPPRSLGPRLKFHHYESIDKPPSTLKSAGSAEIQKYYSEVRPGRLREGQEEGGQIKNHYTNRAPASGANIWIGQL